MYAIEKSISSLDELCRVLNADTVRRTDCRTNGLQSPETADLPKFSRIAPPDVTGIWSWDATRVLFADSKGFFYIEPRDPEAWYPNEKDSPLR